MSRRGVAVLAVVAVIVAGLAYWMVLRPADEPAEPAVAAAPAGPAPMRRPPRPRWLGRLSLPDTEARADADAEFGAISGIVRDWDTDGPVAQAELTFMDDRGAHSVVSGEDGAFLFSASAAGTYRLATVFADTYQPYAPELGQSPVRFVARPGRRIEGVTIYLVPEIEIAGRVVNADGDPASGARIRVLGTGTGETALADTEAAYEADDAGRFTFSAALGTWLEARHDEHGGGRAEVDERTLATRAFEIRLSEAAADADGVLAGVVLDPEGAPLSGARVVAGASAYVPEAETVTDDEGAFRIGDLVPGDYRVEASHARYAPVWTPPIPTGSTRLRLQLAAGGSIEGTIRGEHDEAISGATVLALRHSAGMMRVQQARVTVFDADGSFRLRGLPPGLYDVAGAAHGRGVAKVVDVTVGTGTETVDLRLPAGHTITGRVTDEKTSSPLMAARVELERHVGRGPSIAPIFAAAITDEDGRFELRGVEAGRHSVTAYAREHVARTLSGIEVDDADVGPLAFELAPDEGDGWAFDFAGIGVEIAASRAHLDVRGVLPDGGAGRAGVLVGDRIVAVDGIPVGEYDFNGAVEALRGVEGTEVLLGIERDDEAFDLAVTRTRVRG